MTIVSLLFGCGSAETRRDFWDRQIAEELPEGSREADVRQFLESRELEYSYAEDERTFYAIERAVEQWLIVDYSVTMELQMSESGELASVDLFVVGTGM